MSKISVEKYPLQWLSHNDAERKQDWQEAVNTYQEISKAYLDTGYQVIEVPKSLIKEGVAFILKQIYSGDV